MKKPLAISLFFLTGIASAGLLNLVQCPDCGAMVSTRAFMCPKCGCNAEAIKNQADAGEKTARLSERETEALLGENRFGQVGRLRMLQEKQSVERILRERHEPAPDAARDLAERAKEARVKCLRIIELGFTIDQIYTMRHELVASMLAVKWVKKEAEK